MRQRAYVEILSTREVWRARRSIVSKEARARRSSVASNFSLRVCIVRTVRIEVLPNLRQAGIFQICQKPLTRPGV